MSESADFDALSDARNPHVKVSHRETGNIALEDDGADRGVVCQHRNDFHPKSRTRNEVGIIINIYRSPGAHHSMYISNVTMFIGGFWMETVATPFSLTVTFSSLYLSKDMFSKLIRVRFVKETR